MPFRITPALLGFATLARASGSSYKRAPCLSLQYLFEAAIAKWAAATAHSAFSIIPDHACNGNIACTCDTLPLPVNALVITDLGKLPEYYNSCKDDDSDGTDQSEGDDEENGDGVDNPEINVQQTRTTVGYEHDSSVSGRHYLRFLGYDASKANQQPVWNKWVITMAHELEHAIGLGHEHQRPDRDDYVFFVCAALGGYSTASGRFQGAMKAGKLPQCDDMSLDACMGNVICETYDLARTYFPNAAASYVTGDKIEGFSDWVYSRPFDFRSIMLYGSYEMASRVDNFPSGAILIGTDPGPVENEFEVYQGGDANPMNAGISAGDIARVAQLNDKGTNDGTQAMNLPAWTQAPNGEKRIAPRTTFVTETVTG